MLKTSEWYLYPRFEALEGGATPNYAEVHNYLSHGIALEYVDDYRRHVPDCLPAGSPPPVVDPAPPPPSPPPPPATLALINRVPLQSLAPPTSPPASALPPFSHSLPETGASTRSIKQGTPFSDITNGPVPTTPPAAFYSPHRLDMPSPSMSSHHPARYPGWVMEPVRPVSRMHAWSPYACAPPPAGVSLSLADCEIYRVLSAANPQLANKFMVDVLERGVADMRLRAGSQVRLNPNAAEFRVAAAAAQAHVPPGFSE
ncbi:hypothetical protein K1T71_010028 [Dendrolimus kikuchii]|uniref:Uncharacterized protein n=1 Tax=Dendrolimus kikuchii TaxID=765133 RepID=A0ACC1CQQ1_9NEOP|nr:hypothetical protein K1T71_010028 [Dendrolimus kikuchii]